MCVHNVFLDKLAELCVYLSFHFSFFCMWHCEKKHVVKHLSLKKLEEKKKVKIYLRLQNKKRSEGRPIHVQAHTGAPKTGSQPGI